MRAFASNLKLAREKKGWSQERAAAVIGIPHKNLQSYESDRAQCSLTTLSAICTAYQIEDAIKFIEKPYYDGNKIKVSPLERRYNALPAPIQKAVGLLMGVE